ncbi:lipocalin family protein [Pontibacter sp. KCTC 32443]|uniref:lipocalin family protein n=1 Tax=Pontibacter TaxID=323449 RepID=UPI00164ECF3F|nr:MULTISPECIES: lipocalin family protein [Pontibacter]MBC5774987.1 lipocalin family protein [Pontibacter sp. KCTC 32443]
MNRYQLRYFLLAILFPLFLVSCGDDDDDDVSPNIAQLTAGEWTGDAIIVDGEDITDELLEEEEPFDFRQYTSQFERAGTYNESYQGRTVAEGDWEYQNNDRIIVFDEGTSREYYVVIAKLDDDELFYVQDGVEYRFVR